MSETAIDIQALTDPASLDALFERSSERPVWIFKHSLICPTSASAWLRFRRFVAARPTGDAVDFAMIPIQDARPASNAVAERTGVTHQSPQALLLRRGEVVWHASHGHIVESALEEALADVRADVRADAG